MPGVPKNYPVHHNPAASRFEINVNGQTAVLEYILQKQTIIITHTSVPPALEGQGIGGQLVKAALESAYSIELRVSARCPFAATYIQRHPEYHGLLDQSIPEPPQELG